MSSPSLSEAELRERRRAKILASKDARMSRITGALKENGSSPSLEVDEAKIQEIIAEEKKHAVELAKEDYSKTHVEHENSKDEKLTPAQIAQRNEAKVRSQIQEIHNPHHNEGAALSLFVIVVSALAAAYLLHQRVPAALGGCLNVYGIDNSSEACRSAVFSNALPLVPGCAVVALLPALSELFKGRKPTVLIMASLVSRSLLFLVVFLLSLQAFLYYL